MEDDLPVTPEQMKADHARLAAEDKAASFMAETLAEAKRLLERNLAKRRLYAQEAPGQRRKA